MPLITVNTDPACPVMIERGLLARSGEVLARYHNPCRVALFTDPTVGALYGAALESALAKAGFSAERIILPAGETCKSWQTLGAVLEELAARGFCRSDLVLTLGGGTVGDLGGLAAALYHRGIPCVNLPTTLLAAVDAAIGGKTAVDLAAGKNLAGVIRQPLAVLCDPDLLATLPPPQRANGMAEVIKTGVLGAAGVWEQIARPLPDEEALIAACAAYKAALVASDETDKGPRQLLNLGHTIGHAIEKASGYTVPHGQAVAIGLAAMARAAAYMGDMPAEDAAAIQDALRRWGLPVDTSFSAEVLLPLIAGDKKRRGEEYTIVWPIGIGRCCLRSVTEADLSEILQAGL